MPSGHQTQGSELAATADTPTTILTFPLAAGADVVVSLRVLVRAHSATTRMVRAYTGVIVATRQTGQTGGVAGVLLGDLKVVSGSAALDVSAAFGGSGVAASVVTVAVSPAVDGDPVTAISVQAVFDSLPAGAVVL